MTKELAMQILGLENEFTFEELKKAYEQAHNQYQINHYPNFIKNHSAKLYDIERAYEFLKKNKCYSISLRDTTRNIFYDNDDKFLEYLKGINGEIKLLMEKIIKNFPIERESFIKRISIFLNSPKIVYTDDEDNQITIFTTKYPRFLEPLQKEVKDKVKKLIAQIKEFQSYNDFLKYCEIVEEFNHFIKEIYKKIIEYSLKAHNLVCWDVSDIYDNVFSSMQNRYHQLFDVYDLIQDYINEHKLTSNNAFENKMKEVFDKWLRTSKHSPHFKDLSEEERKKIFNHARNIMKELFKDYLSDSTAIQNGFEEMLIELLDNLENTESQIYHTLNEVIDEKMATYQGDIGFQYFSLTHPIWSQIRERIVSVYGKDFEKGKNPNVTPAMKKDIELIIEEEITRLIELYNKRFYQIKYLLDHYPNFANSSYVEAMLQNFVNPFQPFITEGAFEDDLLKKLNETEPEAQLTSFDSINYIDEIISDETLQMVNPDEEILPNRNTYLVYDGSEFSWLEIEEKFKQYSQNDTEIYAIHCDGMLFAKSGKFNPNCIEPASYDGGYFVSDFKREQESDIADTYKDYWNNPSTTYTFRAALNKFSVLKNLEQVADFTCVAFNTKYHSLFIISHHLPVYIGFTNKGEKMYSNNLSLLRHFCPYIHKMPDESYLIDGDIMPRRKGFDLLVRNYHNN